MQPLKHKAQSETKPMEHLICSGDLPRCPSGGAGGQSLCKAVCVCVPLIPHTTPRLCQKKTTELAADADGD